MKNRLLIAAAVAAILLFSCKKDKTVSIPVATPAPEMTYIDLHDSAVKYAQRVTLFDFDNDGFSDLKFGVLLISDPIQQQDKRQFRISSGIHSRLAVNSLELTPVMNKGEMIPAEDFNGYKWWLVSSVLLVERVENIHGEISWNGHWKNAVRKYLPFQMIKDDKCYNGWVELSVDTEQERIVLHRLALSKEPGKMVKTGL